MKRITKSPEPARLTTFRLQGGDFHDLPKDWIRSTLIADQRALCCYCNARIRDGALDMKIEHFRPQHGHEHLRLAWSNLFAACRGGEGLPPSLQHCDTAKGGQACDLDPLTIVETQISYSVDGTIQHADAELDRQLNEVLHLNIEPLKRRRKATLAAFLRARARRRPGSWTRASVQSELNRLLARDPLDPYCMIVVFWLRKRLARC